jgi:hypothetical protein
MRTFCLRVNPLALVAAGLRWGLVLEGVTVILEEMKVHGVAFLGPRQLRRTPLRTPCKRRP